MTTRQRNEFRRRFINATTPGDVLRVLEEYNTQRTHETSPPDTRDADAIMREYERTRRLYIVNPQFIPLV